MTVLGLPSWGIAWYINGILVPELHLKRGESYTFRVAGGSNPSEGAKYHPLYFTDSDKGGFSQVSIDKSVSYELIWTFDAGNVLVLQVFQARSTIAKIGELI